MLDDPQDHSTFQDKSEEFLQSLQVDNLAFVIISVDIVDSTRLATMSSPKAYALLVSVFLHELSQVHPKFHGHMPEIYWRWPDCLLRGTQLHHKE